MPKILSYTPPWLSRPSSGSDIFTDAPAPAAARAKPVNGSIDLSAYHGPHRLLAQRGSEIFFVAGNQIRWGDLRALKSSWEEGRGPGRPLQGNADASPSYRVRALAEIGSRESLLTYVEPDLERPRLRANPPVNSVAQW